MVSIGVPVYNGQKHLRNTLDSLLAQTYTDFELIISDNASTDSTAEICQEYATRDSRVRYHRHPKNLGAPANWNFVAREARGRYFKWSSASDSCAANFLEVCVAVLEDDPSIVLCFGETIYVDDEYREVSSPGEDVEVLDDRPSERFRQVCERLSVNNEQYGLIRRDALMKTRLDRPYPHGDLVLMAELALLGKFRRLPVPLLVRRAGEGEWTGTMSREGLNALFWPDQQPRLRADFVRRYFDYLTTAFCAGLPLGERFRVARLALRMAYWKRRQLTGDLVSLIGVGRAADTLGTPRHDRSYPRGQD